jgi:cohesin domain-containing protein
MLPERETIGAPAGQVFFPQSWAPPPAPAPAQASAGPTKPAPPPMPYRVVGKMLQQGAPQIVLAKGDAIVTAREGETLDDGYRVESIRRDHVTILYVPLRVRERIPLTSTFILDEPLAAATPKSPQLSWAGPEQVKAGDPFSVALKMSSDQPVRSVPLQLSYDAALLEAVDVRPGAFFLNGLFSYRVSPDGSIFVGASGKETVASDAELVIVTFKPIRAGATAELKISSMTLQGASGTAIEHDRPAAFRTAIVR